MYKIYKSMFLLKMEHQNYFEKASTKQEVMHGPVIGQLIADTP